MSSTRLLKREERRILADALRAAAARTRAAKLDAMSTALASIDEDKRAAYVDQLARLAGTQDRLAAEITEHEVRLERLES